MFKKKVLYAMLLGLSAVDFVSIENQPTLPDTFISPVPVSSLDQALLLQYSGHANSLYIICFYNASNLCLDVFYCISHLHYTLKTQHYTYRCLISPRVCGY